MTTKPVVVARPVGQMNGSATAMTPTPSLPSNPPPPSTETIKEEPKELFDPVGETFSRAPTPDLQNLQDGDRYEAAKVGQARMKIIDESKPLEETLEPMGALETNLSYVETIQRAGLISSALVLGWVCAHLPGSFVWILVLLPIFGGIYVTKHKRLVQRIIAYSTEKAKQTSIYRGDKELAEWLNLALQRIWLVLEPNLSEQLRETINNVLENVKVPGIQDMAITHFELGSRAPRLESILSFPRLADDVLQFLIHVSFAPYLDEEIEADQAARKMADVRKVGIGYDDRFRGYVLRPSRVVLTANVIKGIPMPISVEDLFFEGRILVRVKLSSSAPYLKALNVVRPEDQPKFEIDFKLKPFVNVDIVDFPGLNKILLGVASENVHKIVDGRGFSKLWDSGNDVSQVTNWSRGLLRIKIKRAEHIESEIASMMEVFGHNRPSQVRVIVWLGPSGAERILTKTSFVPISGSVWNECRHVVIPLSALENPNLGSDQIRFEVVTGKDQSLGTTRPLRLVEWIALMNTPPPKDLDEQIRTHNLLSDWGTPRSNLDVWRSLYDVKRMDRRLKGRLNLEVAYVELPRQELPRARDVFDMVQQEQDVMLVPKDPTSVWSRIPAGGILRITVHQARDLPQHGAHATGRGLTKVAENLSNKIADAFDTFLPYVTVILGDEEVYRTSPRRRTTSPLFEETFDCYMADVNQVVLRLSVRDADNVEDVKMGSSGSLLCEGVFDKRDLFLRTYEMDWFKLVPAGRIRLSFTFYPFDVTILDQPIPLSPELATLGKDKARIDQNGFLDVTIVEADELPAGDRGGSSDPFVEMRVGDKSAFKTKVKPNTLKPVWNDNFTVNVPSKLSTAIEFIVRDSDAMLGNQRLGVCQLNISNIPDDTLMDQWLRLEGGSGEMRGGRLHVKCMFKPKGMTRMPERVSSVSPLVREGTVQDDTEQVTLIPPPVAVSAPAQNVALNPESVVKTVAAPVVQTNKVLTTGGILTVKILQCKFSSNVTNPVIKCHLDIAEAPIIKTRMINGNVSHVDYDEAHVLNLPSSPPALIFSIRSTPVAAFGMSLSRSKEVGDFKLDLSTSLSTFGEWQLRSQDLRLQWGPRWISFKGGELLLELEIL